MTTSISAPEAVAQTIFPARKVLLEFSHPTIGDDNFAHMVAHAMQEFHKANPLARTDEQPFVASNGVMVRFHAPCIQRIA